MPVNETTRRARHSVVRSGRRRVDGAVSFELGLTALAELAHAGAHVSARVTDLATGERQLAVDDDLIMPVASIGKVLLLIEVAARAANPAVDARTALQRSLDDAVGDSGVWQHLHSPALPVVDLAALIGATSDNLATNVLLRAVGLDSVRQRAASLGLRRTSLLDRVRDERGPDDAEHLSLASARELTWLFGQLTRGEIVSPQVSQQVVGWLSLNTDLSLVASAFGLDPLAHRAADHGILLMNKTGTDRGIRADAGTVRGSTRGVSYAVLISFADTGIDTRLAVIEAMRAIGRDVLNYVR